MSIRTKIGLILILAVLGFGLTEYGIQRYIVLPGFISLEHDEAIRDGKRVSDAIKNEIVHLEAMCRDWSAWDDTYAFVQSPSETYIESNLPISTFTNNRLHLIFICNREGRVVWGRAYDTMRAAPVRFSEFPADRLPKDHPLFCLEDVMGLPVSASGLMLTGQGPMIVSSCPVITSDNKGPVQGFFVMGRLIDPEMMITLSDQTGVSSALIPLDVDSGYISGRNSWVDISGENELHVHAVLNDIQGKPAFQIRSVLPRPIAEKAFRTVDQGIYSIMVVGLGVLILVLYSLKRNILDPLARFTEHARMLADTGDFSRRIAVSRRKDEIGVLERRFDNLVSRVEESSRKLSDTNRMLQADIERRKQTESALRESEMRFRAVVEQAADAVFLHDLNGRFRDVNRVACERLGYSREELLKMTVGDIDPGSRERNDPKTYWDIIALRSPLIIESFHRTRSGRMIPVEISISPLRLGGELLILALVRDITERKQMEDRIRYTQKMEAVSTLTAGISHNFNNMLSIIIGNTDLALESVTDDKTLRLLKNIEIASVRARDMVWKLIRFSQQNVENRKPIDVAVAVKDRMAILERGLPGNILLQKRIDPDTPPIIGNPEQIEQIITNLWSNALEAMAGSNGGALTITLQPSASDDIYPDPGDSGISHARLTVSDTGRGISPEDIDRIFDPYFTTKDIVEGAGLGLSIVHGIVINSGGAIRVNSRPGEGTRIDIFLPADGEAAQRARVAHKNSCA